MVDWEAVGTIELAPDLVVRQVGFGGAWLTGPGTERVALKHRASSAQVALAWLVQSSPVTVPLPGATRPAWIGEDLVALGIRLGDSELRELD